MSQNGVKTTSLMTSLTKNPQPPTFFEQHLQSEKVKT